MKRLILLIALLLPAMARPADVRTVDSTGTPTGTAANPVRVKTNSDLAAFPWWVVRKIGNPILLEANWTGTFPNTKFGALLSGTGTVTADTTNLLWGGTGSVKMLTDAVNADGAEIKATIAPVAKCGDLLAFEAKFATTFAQSTTELQIGLESRDNANIYQARFSGTINGGTSTLTWQYESAAGVYSAFTTLPGTQGAATTASPAVSTSAGTPVGWARIVIDPCARRYVSFEIPSLTTGGTTIFDLSSISLIQNGSASRALYLPFMYVITHSATAEPAWTTDWALSIIPAGVDPSQNQ